MHLYLCLACLSQSHDISNARRPGWAFQLRRLGLAVSTGSVDGPGGRREEKTFEWLPLFVTLMDWNERLPLSLILDLKPRISAAADSAGRDSSNISILRLAPPCYSPPTRVRKAIAARSPRSRSLKSRYAPPYS